MNNEAPLHERELVGLHPLSREIPNIDAAVAEIARFSAELTLPQGTIHVISDVHGEDQKLRHIINNASGTLRPLVERLFQEHLTPKHFQELLTLIFYPAEVVGRLERTLRTPRQQKDYALRMLHELFAVVRLLAARHSLKHATRIFPTEYRELFTEILHAPATGRDRAYVEAIVNALADEGSLLHLIHLTGRVIRNLTIDELVIAGDCWDRGPRGDRVVDYLMQQPNVALTWGNHDAAWLGAALGQEALICHVMRISLRYRRLLQLEEGYGIPMAPLDWLARTVYAEDPAENFAVKGSGMRDATSMAAFLEMGFNVVCDKPMTFDLKEALALRDLVKRSGEVFTLTHNYTGYPMVKKARDLVRRGVLGTLLNVVAEYSQGWLLRPVDAEGQKQAAWRTNPQLAGASGCVGDIGTHAENLVRYITGLEIEELCADFTAFVAGRRLEDDGSLLLRFKGGARGVLYASQVSAGEENNLSIRVYGTKASLEWQQEDPNDLVVKYPDAPRQVFRRGNAYLSDAAKRVTRLPSGHPEAFIEAFANVYREAARAIRAEVNGLPIPEGLDFPTVEDGVEGMAFIAAAVQSAKGGAVWAKGGPCGPNADHLTIELTLASLASPLNQPLS